MSRAEEISEADQESASELATPIKTATVNRQRTIQSVERAMEILEILATASGGMSLKELAAEAKLNASTCHHILATLANRGFVGRGSNTRNYFLGARITDLSESRLKQFNLVDIALPELRFLNDLTKESVHLSAIQGAALVTLAKLDSKLPVRVGFDDDAEKANAAHAMAAGKAILAWLPETEMARVIAHCGFKKFTDRTISTISELIEDLRHVRRNGYSFENEEFQPGVVCVGAAIRDQSGAVIGSIGTAMPRMRAEGTHLDLVRRTVKECGMRISAGYGSPKGVSRR